MSQQNQKIPKLKLFGERIALLPLEEELEGIIKVPSNVHRDYDLGKIFAIGDGLVPAVDGGRIARKMHYEVGQTVLFAINRATARSLIHTFDGLNTMIIHQGDILGILTERVVKRETFKIGGNWVLVEAFRDRDNSIIIKPETAIETMRYRVVDLGLGALDEGYAVGDEVAVNRNRANQIWMSGEKDFFYYVDKNDIHGVVEPETEQS